MGFDKCIIIWIYRYSTMQNSLTALKTVYISLSPNPGFLLSPQSVFQGCHRVGIRRYVAFAPWLLSLSDMHVSSLDVFWHKASRSPCRVANGETLRPRDSLTSRLPRESHLGSGPSNSHQTFTWLHSIPAAKSQEPQTVHPAHSPFSPTETMRNNFKDFGGDCIYSNRSSLQGHQFL